MAKIVLESCFVATFPGYVTGVRFDCIINKERECWRIKFKCISTRIDGTEYLKIEYYGTNSAYIICTFGKEYAAYVV